MPVIFKPGVRPGVVLFGHAVIPSTGGGTGGDPGGGTGGDTGGGSTGGDPSPTIPTTALLMGGQTVLLNNQYITKAA